MADTLIISDETKRETLAGGHVWHARIVEFTTPAQRGEYHFLVIYNLKLHTWHLIKDPTGRGRRAPGKVFHDRARLLEHYRRSIASVLADLFPAAAAEA